LEGQERETATVLTWLETAVVLAGHLANEHYARAKTMEQQLTRMDGLPAALLVAQQTRPYRWPPNVKQRCAPKLDGLTADAKIKLAARKKATVRIENELAGFSLQIRCKKMLC